MELIWSRPTNKKAETFNNDSSPYAHFWLDQALRKKSVRYSKRSNLIRLSTKLMASVGVMIRKAFER